MQFYSDVIMFKATHNIYLKVATEAGLPAFLLFLFLIGAFLKDSWTIANGTKDPEVRAFAYGMLGYIVALSVSALGVDVYFQTDVNGQFWVMMGALMQAPLVCSRGTEERHEAPAETPPTRPLYELVR